MMILCLCAAALLSPSRALVLGMDGSEHNPLALGKGMPQAFVFVNHDCPICNSYSPELERLENEFKGKVKIQLVFSEPDESIRNVRGYEKTYGLTGVPAWVDDSRRFAAECGATVVPEAILFDAAGSKVWAGRIDDQWASLGVRRQVSTTHDLETALASLAKGQRPTPSVAKPVGCIILSPSTQ